MLIKDPKITVPCIGGALGYFSVVWWEPVLAYYLLEFKELSYEVRGLFYVLVMAVYMLTGISIGYLPSWIEGRVILFAGLIVNMISLFLIGPF